jgi:myo-inositol-1(or 4)-monophosphatase
MQEIVPAGASGLAQLVGHSRGRLGARVGLRASAALELPGEVTLAAAAKQLVEHPSHTCMVHPFRPESEMFAGSFRDPHCAVTSSPRLTRVTRPHELLPLAEDAARQAGRLLLERFRRPPTGLESKSTATDLVSDADRDAERLLRDLLGKARPDDGILGEEAGEDSGTSGVRWVVDPLDGTVNYLFGLPSWAVSIACEDADGLLAAVVHDPLAGETFTAARGRGAALNGVPIACSGATDLATALIATGFAYLRHDRAIQAAALAQVLPHVRDVRRAGSAALDLAYVACGRLDAYYETGPSHWDLAAGTLLVREAGGVVSTLRGIGSSRDGVVAATPAVHDELARLADDALQRSVQDNSLH